MMRAVERAVCESCGRRQGSAWKPGSPCESCSGRTRAEQRCAWCTVWVPAARECAECGCGLIDSIRWGAARMLKDGGVDRYSLKSRLDGLDAEQLSRLGRLFDTERERLSIRVEEARFCEARLLGAVELSRLVEEELLARIPLPKGSLAELTGFPLAPFDLTEMARASPIPLTRGAAAIALLRAGQGGREVFASALSDLREGNPLEVEAALALGSFRVPSGWVVREDRERARAASRGALSHADARVRGWAAVTLAVLEDPNPPPLADAVQATDPELAFAAALALGDPARLEAAFGAADPVIRELAAERAVARGLSCAARPLLEGPEDLRQAAVRALPRPIPEALREPALVALERGSAEVRRRVGWALAESQEKDGSTLTEARVSRAATVMERERDGELAKALLFPRSLPGAAGVVEGVFQASVHGAPYVADSMGRQVEAGALSAETLLAVANAHPDESRALVWLILLERAYAVSGDPRLRAKLLSVLFGEGSVKVRAAACWALRRAEGHDRSWESHPAKRFHPDPAGLSAQFGDAGTGVRAIVRLLRDRELMKEVGVYDWARDVVAELDPSLRSLGAPFEELVVALREVAFSDYWKLLRTAALDRYFVCAPREQALALVQEIRGGALGKDSDFDVAAYYAGEKLKGEL